MATKPQAVDIPGIGRTMVLVDREQLRKRQTVRRLTLPPVANLVDVGIPTPPPTFDFSKGEAIKYPILGNNQYGDCYYADICHAAQTMTGQAGTETQFDEQKVIQRYKQLSGGDNGLSDDDVFPEWKGGIVGPNGPCKMAADMLVKDNDPAAIKLAMWLFCGANWTCSLGGGWANNATPGAVWDRNNYGRAVGGHAMHLTGIDEQGRYHVRTWGISPPVLVTQDGIDASESEVWVAFSLDMFRPDGICPANGLHYTQLAEIWHQLGGEILPPSPFPPAPTPAPPGPTPVPPGPAPGPGGLWEILTMVLYWLWSVIAQLFETHSRGRANMSADSKGGNQKFTIPPWLLQVIIAILQALGGGLLHAAEVMQRGVNRGDQR